MFAIFISRNAFRRQFYILIQGNEPGKKIKVGSEIYVLAKI